MTENQKPAIKVESLTFRYPSGRIALHDLSFEVPSHDKIALVGANGSGKSTLLLHLNGILRATAGSISISGVSLSEKTIPQIRAWVGLLFQNPDDQLFSTNVYDDVAFAARYMGLSEPDIKNRVMQALALVGMETYVDRVSYHLSMGEKKRIALATVLTMDTRILALDEPSAGLDPRARRELIHLLKTFTQQTILISTHDMRLAAELCTHVIVLDAGQIVANGTVEAVLYNRSLMEQHGLETPE